MHTNWRQIQDEREKYAAYLSSREWAELRNKVIKRAGGKCERCWFGSVENVHHLTYLRKYDEHLDDLQGLCLECHKFTHGKTDVDPRLSCVELARIAVNEHQLACPFCECEFVHFGEPEQIDGNDNYEASEIMSVRGDVIVIPFYCEAGHEWDSVLGFHKGFTFRSIVPQYDRSENNQLHEYMEPRSASLLNATQRAFYDRRHDHHHHLEHVNENSF